MDLHTVKSMHEMEPAIFIVIRGDCDNIMVECPENNLNNSCKIYCDADLETYCKSITVYSTNGYCKDALYYVWVIIVHLFI